jgi:RHS repeat-associated protein
MKGVDERGQVLQFEYYGSNVKLPNFSDGRFREVPGYLKRLIRPDSSVIEYDYDENLNLARVRFDDGTSTEYHYENETYINHLTGITDRLGNRYASWEYNYDGLAVSSEHAGGVERVTLEYERPLNSGDIGTTYVTNSEGGISIYRWRHIQSTGDILLISSDGPGCATCPPTNMRYSYSHDHKLITEADSAGNERHFSYDDLGRIKRIDRIAVANADRVLEVRYEYEGSNLRPSRLFKPSVNNQGEYQLAISYGDDNLPTQITESGFAPTVPSETGQLASLYKPISRTTHMRYEEGRISEIDGPRSDVEDVTRFRYDQLGRLSRMELPSGEHIDINKYDEHGRALEFRRAQHPTVTLLYDSHGNISKISSLGQSVSYSYNAENRLISVSSPNGKTSTLSYDEAQRLKSVSDDLGRTVHLSLNSESKVQNKSFLGINGALISSLNYVLDAEGRIQSVTKEQQDHTSGNIFSKTVDIEYDDAGMLNGASDQQSGVARSFVFNDLGLLLETIEPNGLSERKEYDVHNRLVAQTDRRLSTTRYYRDDFGHIHFLVSPDTGVTQYRYDEAGNRTEKLNANSELTRYQWDAANRLVKQQDDQGDTTYQYHTNSGRLLETTNSSGKDSYTYTQFAQLRSHTRHIDGHKFTTQYAYHPNGKLRHKTLPDGQVLRYHYYESGPDKDNLRAITRESLFGLSKSTLLGEVDLDWRDGRTSYLSHNGRRNEYQYHADGKLASLSITDTLEFEYEYDEDGNIVGIDKNGYKQEYNYSAGQLSSASTLTGNYNYQYDVTGNRTAASAFASARDHSVNLSYSTASNGNQLQNWIDSESTDEVNYSYNNAGSPIKAGELRYKYNANQRPVEISQDGDVVAQYHYNSFGERIKKVTYSRNQKKVTYYLYDNRMLVAEIDGETLEYRQTIYLKHTPVVHLVGNTSYAVHTDHLGTPKLLTNDIGGVVWEAAHTPLGEAVVEKQDIRFNLRLPGQYFDSETGTHYNYQRDYDPRTGRFLTSDPVGLEGGDNTYAYADNNVLGAIDVLGLSVQLAGLPALPNAITDGGQTTAPFVLRNAGNGVANPSALPPELTELGITDPNELVTGYITQGSPCDSELGIGYFNEGISGLPAFLTVTELDEILEYIRFRRDHPELEVSPEYTAILKALVVFENTFDDLSLLVVPACTDLAGMTTLVSNNLGSLVHPDEVTALLTSLGEPGTQGCGDGEYPAGIIDVSQLHEEVLRRFEVKLATDDRVVEAERELLLAQEALATFMRLHNNKNPCLTEDQPFANTTPNCSEWMRLYTNVDYAAEALANTLNRVYEELSPSMMPPSDTAAIAAERRRKILWGVVGIFVPLTPQDAAIEAGIIAATAGFGKAGKVIDGVADLFRIIRNGNRGEIDNLLSAGSEGAARANAIKMQRYRDYQGLQGFNYPDVVRLEGKLGSTGLRKLETDFVNTPSLATAFKSDPSLVDAWKAIDDIGACSFDGSTAVVTETGLKSIESLVAGVDRVLARDEITGAQEFKNILAQYSTQYAEKVVIRSSNNVTNEQVSVVSNKIHPIFIRSTGVLRRVASEGQTYLGDQEYGEWVDASKLRVGDSLKNDNGTWSTIQSVAIIADEFTAYNLTVEDFNTYFVSEQGKSSAFWVHNTCINVIKSDPVALAQMNRLAASNNLNLNHNDIADLISEPFRKGQQWDNPKKVLNALQRSSGANIPGLVVNHKKFPARSDGAPDFVLDNAKKYQEEASGDAGLSFELTGPTGNTVSFDDVDGSGALIDRKWGHGGKIFEKKIHPDGSTEIVTYNTSREQSILEQARRQIEAAGGNADNSFTPTTSIKWEISTELGAEGIEQLFLDNGINISVEWVEQIDIVVP